MKRSTGRINRIEKEHISPVIEEKQKIAFVCQRYGPAVNGGAELLCRLAAERLAAFYDVTVYTTCAVDYITWGNVYPPGREELNGVHVQRFPVERERRPRLFNLLSRVVFHDPFRFSKLTEKWIDAQGPFCPELIESLKRDHRQFKAVLFMTYLYYTTVRGMGLNLHNAILIPTVHDEPTVYLKCFDRVFENAKGYIWLTPEERAFARRRFPQIAGKPEVLTGVGIEENEEPLPPLPDAIQGNENGSPPEYLLYSGRIDVNKGCDRMFEYFRCYKREHPGSLRLVLTGKEVYPVPKDPDIISLGYVDEDVRRAVMSGALALILFSKYESLSMVVLESMAVGRPVIVDEQCEVLRGHCERSGAGLAFSNYAGFEAAVEQLRRDKNGYATMCKAAKAYVREYYRWDVILDRYREIIGRI